MAELHRYFGTEDVHVTLPFDKFDVDGELCDVKIKKKKKDDDKRMKRVVINFYVVADCKKGGEVAITEFGPDGMELKVGYEADEVDEDLRYLDPAENKWIEIPHTKVSNGKGKNIGYGVASLMKWPGDPNVGWGGGS